MYFIKIRNMTSAIAPLVSLRNRLRQALSRCSGFFDPVLSKTSGTQTDILPDAGAFPGFSVFLATAASSLCISKIRRTSVACRLLARSIFGRILVLDSTVVSDVTQELKKKKRKENSKLLNISKYSIETGYVTFIVGTVNSENRISRMLS